MRGARRLLPAGAAVLAAAIASLRPGAAGIAAPTATSCASCHSDREQVSEESLRIVELFADDVHASVGLSCHDCHGGNPDAGLAADMERAMDEHFPGRPFRGSPQRAVIPALCASCHSNPTYMKRFKPDIRVDQEQEYWTSQHGKALKQGDTRVATCVDCHGAHGILRPDDGRSPVYPTRVAETCRTCHADPDHMRGSVLPDGRPLPIDQYARWQQSVHAKALLEKGDLSAPTCNDCHGNHGAAPPGLDSIAFVCGRCHGREADLFRQSVKLAGFEKHNALLKDSGPEGCASCHSSPSPQAMVTIRSFGECTSCHGNHGVVRPTIAMLAPLPATPCAFCHEGLGPLSEEVPELERIRRRYETTRDGLLAEAATQGLEGELRFDWLVDQALGLPTHTVGGRGGDIGTTELRPEFEHLFTKFRIGKTHHAFDDPATGRETSSRILRCSDCHGSPEELGTEMEGFAVSQEFLNRMRELTAVTARAERLLLAARRGGVETREALADIEGAVNAQIELEVLVHGFASGEGSPFLTKHQEGLKHAEAALLAGRAAHAELGARRMGLYATLGFIILVLLGLALKIRALPVAAEEDRS